MSNLALFMKKNKKIRENSFYPATKSICDENGNPVLWEIRPLTTAETEKIRDNNIKEVPIPGKKGQYRTKVDTQGFTDDLMVAAIVYPDLNNAELQDSYGVMGAKELLKAMVDNPSEYADLSAHIQKVSGYDTDLSEEVEEAKN